MDKSFCEQGDAAISYHLGQYDAQKQSTLYLASFLRKYGKPSKGEHVLDMCCGGGAVLNYLCSCFPGRKWTGLDIRSDNIEMAMERRGGGVKFITGDIYMPASLPRADGVICVQTLSWLTAPWVALENMLSCGALWIAVSSLFYDGPVSAEISIRQSSQDGTVTSHFYNIFSLPEIKEFAAFRGYSLVAAEPFLMDVELEKPSHGRMGTFTRKAANGELLQFSGPLYMPWYFLILQKDL